MKEKTNLFSLQLPESWLKEISKIAERECRTQASVVRQAIKELLGKKIK